MRTYENKDELKNEINKSFAKYISEFNDIPEHLKDKRIDEIDRTPAENLAYQVGWTTLVIKWESDERKGIPVIPATGLWTTQILICRSYCSATVKRVRGMG